MEQTYDALWCRGSPWKLRTPTSTLKVHSSEKRRIRSDPGIETTLSGVKKTLFETPRTPLRIISNTLGISPGLTNKVPFKQHALNKDPVGGTCSVIAKGDPMKSSKCNVDKIFHTPLKSKVMNNYSSQTPKIEVYNASAERIESEIQCSEDIFRETESILPEFWTEDDESFIDISYLKKSVDIWSIVGPPVTFAMSPDIVMDEGDLPDLDNCVYNSTPPYILEDVVVPFPWEDL